MINYVVSPGTVLKEYMTARNITQKELAMKINSSERHISEVINGKTKLTEEFALKLEDVFLDKNAEFWLELEKNYQLNKLRLEKMKEDFNNIDLKEIAKEYQFDYVFKGLGMTIEEKANSMLEILGVKSFLEANELALKQDKLFSHDGGNPKAQITWLKLCEDEAYVQNDFDKVKNFDKNKLEKNLLMLKKIINTTDFWLAVKNIRKFLNMHGILLVIMDAVPTSLVRGALTTIDGTPAIYLSKRFKKLDTFYFTLTHEIKHLLEDDLTKSDYLNVSYEDDDREKEANDFAKSFLIDKDSFIKFVEKEPLTDTDIIIYSNIEGIVPDVIIGFVERYYDKVKNQKIYGKFNSLRTKIPEED